MESLDVVKPHAVLIPYPAQGHVNPMQKLANLLHFRGFHVTFVHSEFNGKRLLKARGPNALDNVPGFHFETIPDGLPTSDADATQDIPSLCDSARRTCLAPLTKLLARLGASASAGVVPAVSIIVADAGMPFSYKAAQEFGLPIFFLWTASASGLLCYSQYPTLIEKGIIPLKDESYLTNGYLDTEIEWIPGIKRIRLRDLPSFLRTTDINDVMLNYVLDVMSTTKKVTGIIMNTFEELDHEMLNALSQIFPPTYTIGPLNLLVKEVTQNHFISIGSNLWVEDTECTKWLDSKQPGSVVFVNYGSITVMTPHQLSEFAWGLANSKKPFLWVIRPDLVEGGSIVLSPEFVNETKNRGFVASWCDQEQVLNHPSVGGFLTHCGWNSVMESLTGGVPLVCWPFFAEQQTNCRFACYEWGIGLEIDTNVKRVEVEKLVNELMVGEKGKAVRATAMEWKKKAERAVSPSGSSYRNFDKLLKEELPSKNPKPKLAMYFVSE